MLRFLYQLDHDFQKTAWVAAQVKGDDDGTVETVELVVHQFGATLNPWVILEFLSESKLHLVFRRLEINTLSDAGRTAMAEFTGRWDHPTFLLRGVVPEIISRDRPDLLHQLVVLLNMQGGYVEGSSWLDLPVVWPASILRYMGGAMGILPYYAFKTALRGPPRSPDVVGSLLSSRLALSLV